MNYTVNTVPDIGSDSQTSKINGTYTVSVSGLQYSTSYTWYVNVSDGTHWTNETFTFTTGAEPAVWWNPDWEYRKEIVVNHSMVEANLINFPILINITDLNLSLNAQSTGNDIAFADYYGNL